MVSSDQCGSQVRQVEGRVSVMPSVHSCIILDVVLFYGCD